MWFTSRDAYKDLRLWMTLARLPKKNHLVSKMFPEELALYSVDFAGASKLRQALFHAKLY